MGSEPGFEVLIGSLPVFPDGGAGFDGATIGAKIVDVEGFKYKVNDAGGFFEVVKNELGVFGEVEIFIETAYFGVFAAIEFVNG